jgi:RHS repeat-associated protein
MYFYLNDYLGTPQILVDASNTVVWEAKYKPFGDAEVHPSSTVVNNFRFRGQYLDAETGLHYNYHRYYDPQTGRYLTPDPIGLAGGINLYTYANENSINVIDPLGLFEIYIFDSSERRGSTYGAVVFVRGDSGKTATVFGSSWPNPGNPNPGIAKGTYSAVYRDKGHKKSEPGVRLRNGLSVPTLGPNPAQDNQSFATGINIHCGYGTENRGSAGCPTIAPDECGEFFDVLQDRETGTVTVIRGNFVIGR